ncbi:MAG: ACP S-malonyltransferase [Gemmataceae bacterium]|nr:ACP S-malonyltransferase [Gemmataceae bacterium]MDW8266129.1 ACP S-malonyltransferase [Gemmataceae bacterium]
MPRIAFLFPGQGAQSIGMGQTLCDRLPAARRLFDEAATILGYDLAQLCFHGPAERLNSTVVSQPAIFVSSLAALESLKETEPATVEACEATAGLSLGEYTALVFAGALSFADGLRVVQQRGEAMQAASDAQPSGMVSILGLEPEQVEELCAAVRPHGWIQIANRLCPGNLVVSGTQAACEAIIGLAEAQGARTVRLTVAGAFHTPLMKPADERLAAALAGVEIHKPRIPVWSNVDAQPHTDPAEIRSLLVQQVVQPVLWEQILRNLLAAGIDRFYEIGPGRVLAGLLKRVQRRVECQNVTA